jgi:hypothetical protein
VEEAPVEEPVVEEPVVEEPVVEEPPAEEATDKEPSVKYDIGDYVTSPAGELFQIEDIEIDPVSGTPDYGLSPVNRDYKDDGFEQNWVDGSQLTPASAPEDAAPEISEQASPETPATPAPIDDKEAELMANLNAALDGQTVNDETKTQLVEESPVDTAAHEAAPSPTNDTPKPTEAQIEAGNYKKGHINVAGLDITIENPQGSVRSGTGADGNEWSVTMNHHYGYMLGSEGNDGDQIDTYVNPGMPEDWEGDVTIIDQLDDQGNFDEHKVMLGWEDSEDAVEAYLSNYEEGWDRLDAVLTTIPMDEFKEWAASSDAKKIRASEWKKADSVEPLDPRPRVPTEPDTRIHSMADVIALKGGIDRDQMGGEVDPANYNARAKRVPVGKGDSNVLYRRGAGMSPEGMAQALSELGFTEVLDEAGNYSENKMFAALNRIEMGEEIWTGEGLDTFMEEKAAERNAALAQLGDTFTDDAYGADFDDLARRMYDAMALAAEVDPDAVEALWKEENISDTEIFERLGEIIWTGETTRGESDQPDAETESAGVQAEAEDQPLLGSYTQQDLEQRDQERADAEAAEREATQRAEIDKDVDDFVLTGSDRTADTLGARGQTDLMDAMDAPQREPELTELDGIRVGDRVEYVPTGKPRTDGTMRESYTGTVLAVADRSGNKRADVQPDDGGNVKNESLKRLKVVKDDIPTPEQGDMGMVEGYDDPVYVEEVYTAPEYDAAKQGQMLVSLENGEQVDVPVESFTYLAKEAQVDQAVEHILGALQSLREANQGGLSEEQAKLIVPDEGARESALSSLRGNDFLASSSKGAWPLELNNEWANRMVKHDAPPGFDPLAAVPTTEPLGSEEATVAAPQKEGFWLSINRYGLTGFEIKDEFRASIAIDQIKPARLNSALDKKQTVQLAKFVGIPHRADGKERTKADLVKDLVRWNNRYNVLQFYETLAGQMRGQVDVIGRDYTHKAGNLLTGVSIPGHLYSKEPPFAAFERAAQRFGFTKWKKADTADGKTDEYGHWSKLTGAKPNIISLLQVSGMDKEVARSTLIRNGLEPEAEALDDIWIDDLPEEPSRLTGFGETNTIVTREEADAAEAALRAKLGTTYMNLDPELLKHGLKLAAFYIEGGARKFPDFARKMLDRMGERVRPYLKFWYNTLRDTPEMGLEEDKIPDRTGMDSGETVMAFDLDALEEEDVPSSPGDMAPDSRDAAVEEPVDAPPVQDGGGRDDRGAGVPGESTQATGAPQQGDSGVSGVRPPAGGTSSDQPIHRPDGELEPSERPPGTGDGRGNDPTSSEGQKSQRDANEEARRDAIRDRLNASEKKALQKEANKRDVVLGDAQNVEETLPYLIPPQQEDVVKAEARFAEHSGILFTNATGTGKTYTGLGIINRHIRASGDDNVLIVVPTQPKVADWIEDGKNLEITISALTDKKDKGAGPVITTYANFRNNWEVVDRDFSLIVYDESHYLKESKNNETQAFQQHRAITHHPGGAGHLATRRDPEGKRLEYGRRKAMDDAVKAAEQEIADRIEAETGQKPNKKDYEITGDDAAPIREQASEDWLLTHQNDYRELYKRAAAEAERLTLTWKQPVNTVFLSASPFPYHFSLDYAEGFLYTLPEDTGTRGYNDPSPRDDFYIKNLGYRKRYGELQTPDVHVDQGIMERQLAEKFREEGALSGRMLETGFDYSREFVRVEDSISSKVDRGFKILQGYDPDTGDRSSKYKKLPSVARKRFRHHKVAQLLEALKATHLVERINQHRELGRRVVVFHDFRKPSIEHPFRFSENDAFDERGNQDKELLAEIAMFNSENPDLVNLPIDNLGSVTSIIERAFGDKARYVNGDISPKQKLEAISDFNNDASDAEIIVIQRKSGREGISLHDKAGGHQRALIDMGLPIAPVDALQTEGRTNRFGMRSNAIFEYPVLHTSFERIAFFSKVSERASTAENLAMGDLARALKQSFQEGYQEFTRDLPNEEQGTGGILQDKSMANDSPFQRSKTFYWSRRKNDEKRGERKGFDYYPTPEPLGFKMVEWGQPRAGEDWLEPSAGHGAIARFFSERTRNTAIEQSFDLHDELQAYFDGKKIRGDFEDLSPVNKFNVVVMNPPFGKGSSGAMAIDHLNKAAHHLRDGGRVIAIIPESADKRFDKWLYGERDDTSKDAKPEAPDMHLVASIGLPRVTFDRAGTSVKTRIVVLDKASKRLLEHTELSERRRPRDIEADDINEFFDRIENLDLPDRIVVPADYDPTPKKKPSKDAETPTEAETKFDQGFFEPHENVHRQKGTTVYVAHPTKRVDKSVYAEMLRVAESMDGYYSKWHKPKEGAYRGFVFNTAEQRDAFIEALTAGKFSRRKPTETAAFKEWFGDSVLRNEDGSPRVMYHGTKEDFDTFRTSGTAMGIHIGTNQAAAEAGLRDQERGPWLNANVSPDSEDFVAAQEQDKGFNVMPVYVRLENPLRADDFGMAEWAEESAWRKMADKRINDPSLMGSPNEEAVWRSIREFVDDKDNYRLHQVTIGRRLMEIIKERGYDGIVYKNVAEDIGQDSYIVFDPAQIKSATANRGTFDLDDPNIMFSKRPRDIQQKNAKSSPLYEERDSEFLPQSEVAEAIQSDKTAARILSKGDTPVDGDRVGVRLNLNVLKKTGVAVQSVHEGRQGEGYTMNRGWWGGKVRTYAGVVTLKNAFFNVHQAGREKIATRETTKHSMASVDGEWQASGHSKDGIEIRFNPMREHLFTDMEHNAIQSAEEVTISGDRAYARGRVRYYAKREAPAQAGPSSSDATFLFARSDGAFGGLTQRGLERMIQDKYGESTVRRLQDEGLEIIERVGQLPPQAGVSPDEVIYGWHNPLSGKTYLIAEHLNAENWEGVFLHEVGVHAGLQGLLGDKLFDETLQRIDQALKMGLRGAGKNNKLVQAVMAAYEGLPEGTPAAYLQEEILAYVIEETTNQGIPLFKRVLAAIRAYLHRITGGRFLNPTPNDLVAMAQAAVYKGSRNETFTGQPSAGLFSREDEHLKTAKQKAGIVPKPRRTIANRVNDLMNRARAHDRDRMTEGIFDRMDPTKRLITERVGALPAGQDPYVAQRLSTGGSSSMFALMMKGQLEWRDGILSIKEGSDSLFDILLDANADGHLDDFWSFMIGRRAKRLMKEGKENLFTAEEIKALLSRKKDHFEDVAKRFDAFKKSVLDVAEEAGLIDPDTRAVWDLSDWVPFYRMTDKENAAAPRTTEGFSHQWSQIIRLRGGTAELRVDPLQNILMNFSHLIDAGLKNHALRLTIDTFSPPDGDPLNTDLIEPVSRVKMRRALIPMKQVKEIVQQNLLADGFSEDEAANLIAGMPEETFEGIRRMWAVEPNAGPDIIRLMRNGKTEYYRVKDPALLRNLTGLKMMPMWDNPVYNFLRTTKQVLTVGVVATPGFMARNLLRDMLHAWVVSPEGFTFGVDSLKGALQSIKEDDAYYDLAAAGASFATGGYIDATDPESMANSLRRALRKRGLSEREIDNYMGSMVGFGKDMWSKWRSLGDALENSSRMAVYNAVLEKTGERKLKEMAEEGEDVSGLDPKDYGDRAQAAFEAKDLMDYSMRGNYGTVRILSETVPFLNAMLVGEYKLWRSGALPNKHFKAKVFGRALLITLATLALYATNRDEPEYEALEPWDKRTNWHIYWPEELAKAAGVPRHWRIPRPFTLGQIFATVPELMARSALYDKRDSVRETFTEMLHMVRDTLTGSIYEIQGITPLLELAMNRDSFTNRPIESVYDKRSAKNQWDERTSRTMRWLGGNNVLSPQQLEHLWDSYLGGIGTILLGAVDELFYFGEWVASPGKEGWFNGPEKPDRRWDNLPLFKAFWRESPAYTTRYKTQFYDMLETVRQIAADKKHYTTQDDVDALEALIETDGDKMRAKKNLERAARQMSGWRKEIKEIERNPTMSGERKRKAIDVRLAKINTKAENVVRRYAEAFGYAPVPDFDTEMSWEPHWWPDGRTPPPDKEAPDTVTERTPRVPEGLGSRAAMMSETGAPPEPKTGLSALR